MANDFEVRVGVDVDESELSQLEQRLLALRDKDGKISIDVDTAEGRQKINDLYSTIKRTLHNVRIEPTMDISTVKKNIAEIQRYLNQAVRYVERGLDPSKLFSLDGTSLRKISQQMGKLSNEALDAMTKGGTFKKLAEADFFNSLGGNLDISKYVNDFLGDLQKLDKNSSKYFDNVEKTVRDFNNKITSGIQQSFETSLEKNQYGFTNKDFGFDYRIQEDGTARFVQTLKDGKEAIVEFDNAGNKLTKNLDSIQQSFKTVEGGAEAFENTFNETQKAQMLSVLEQQLKQFGSNLQLSEQDVKQYVTSVVAQFDRLGNLKFANIKAVIDGVTLDANFKPSEVFNQEALELSDVKVTDNTSQKALQNLKKTYKELIRLQKDYNKESRAGRTDNAAEIQSEIQDRQKLAESYKEQIRNQELLAQAEKEYQQSLRSVERDDSAKREADEVANTQKQLQKLKEAYREIETFTKQYYEAQNQGNKTLANTINEQIQDRKKLAQSYESELQNVEELTAAQKKYKETMDRINAAEQDRQIKEKDNATVKNIDETLRKLSTYQQKIDQLQKSGDFNAAGIEHYQQQIEKLTNSLQELGVTYDATTNRFSVSIGNLVGKDIVQTQQAAQKLVKTLNEFQTKDAGVGASQLTYIDNQKIKEAENLLEQLQKKKLELAKTDMTNSSDTAAISKLNQEITELDNKLASAERAILSNGQAVSESAQYMNKLENAAQQAGEAMDKMQSSATRAGDSTKQLSSGFDSMISNCTRMAASFMIFDKLEDALYRSVDAVQELDKQMTELQMVTEQSDASVTKMMGSYADMAKDLGTTLQDVSSGSVEWLNFWSL